MRSTASVTVDLNSNSDGKPAVDLVGNPPTRARGTGQRSREISIPLTCKGVERRRVSVGSMGMGEWEDAGH